MSDDENKSGSPVATAVGVIGGGAGAGYFADRVAKNRGLKNLLGHADFLKVLELHATGGDVKAHLVTAGLSENAAARTAELLTHKGVTTVAKEARTALEAHRAQNALVATAIENGTAEAITITKAENGTHSAQVTMKGSDKPIELKGIKTLPEGIEVGTPLTSAQIQELAKTNTSRNKLHLLPETKDIQLEHVAKIEFKPVDGAHEVNIHLTEAGKTVYGRHSVNGAILGGKLTALEDIAKAGETVVLEGKSLQEFAKPSHHGALKTMVMEAEAAHAEEALKPLRTAMQKAAKFGLGFKNASGAGKAVAVGATIVGAVAGGKILSSIFGGGKHADRVESSREQQAPAPEATR